MKSNLSKLLDSPYSLWALLALPSVGMLVGGMAYGELMHASGEFSARLMILALAVTPLRALFPDTRWIRWLLRRRRWIGVAAFGYAALHTLFYLTELGDWASIVGDGLNAGIWTGWIAFLIFVPLALTSNDRSVRWLGKRWKKLQRMVYVAAVLTLAHWALVDGNLVPALVNFAPLILAQAARLWKVRPAPAVQERA